MSLGFTFLGLLFYFVLLLVSLPGFNLGSTGLVPSKSEIHQTPGGSSHHHDTKPILGLAINRIRSTSGDASNEESVLRNKTVFVVVVVNDSTQRGEYGIVIEDRYGIGAYNGATVLQT
jgi:hypothetical protein